MNDHVGVMGPDIDFGFLLCFDSNRFLLKGFGLHINGTGRGA